MSDQFIGKVLADKYRIDSLMRATDLGKIYHGTHLLMDKHVAVKILSPALAIDESIVKRFSAEARNISNLSHPNLLNVTDFGSDREGTVFIVFEDAEGESLKDVIQSEGGLTAARAVNLTKQIASALAAAHLKGIVHGNLNSENILLTANEEVKVLDLGLPKPENPIFDEENCSVRIQYFAPEQCADVSQTDARSDIYSLGVMFYEMLAGEVPFAAETPSNLMMKHAQEPPPPLSAFRQDLPAEIEPIILQMLAKNPDMRHQTAAELIDDLNRVERHLAETETAAAAPVSNNNIWKTAFVVLAGISLLSVGLIWATSIKQTNPTTLQTDANSQPVQPINPATGLNEQGLANIVPIQSDLANSNTMVVPPDTLGGSDTNPYWQNGTVPPGAPQPVYVAPPGNVTSVPPCGSQFMPCDGVIIVPKENNTNVNVQVSPTPKTTKTPPANTTAQPTPAPDETPKPQTNPTVQPKTEKNPQKKEPKTNSSPNKPTSSGKTQDG